MNDQRDSVFRMSSCTPIGGSDPVPGVHYSIFPNSRDVAFPGLTGTIRVASEYGKRLFDNLDNSGEFIWAKAFKDDAFADLTEIILPGVKTIGTLCRAQNIVRSETAYVVEVQGLVIVSMDGVDLDVKQRLVTCTATKRNDIQVDPATTQAFLSNFINSYRNLQRKYPTFPEFPDMSNIPVNVQPFYIANFINSSATVKQSMLECVSPVDRIKMLVTDLSRFNLDQKIDYQLDQAVNEAMDRNQTEFILRSKMRELHRMLKEFDGDDPDDRYEKALTEHKDLYPEFVQKRIREELDRMKTMPAGSQEASVVKSYLDLVIRLPWLKSSTDNEDLKRVQEVLDEDHYGLVRQKQRVIEYLAVKGMTRNLKAPILCLYGPPGVGKTSLAISIARALNRKFQKIALGGISDEAEIRGHRRTYVGSMPGRIINALLRSEVNNPVILLDEIDKIDGGGYHGDPASALLEVLDPEQNALFEDNYLDMPFDLSNVLFICTANDLSQIPAALADRLELIELNTYTKYEKMHIAREHLVKLEEKANGLKPGMVTFTDEALDLLIEGYTREAGVRELRRRIGTIMRKFAVLYLEDPAAHPSLNVTPEVVREMLLKPPFTHMESSRRDQVGIINGLAYTEYGGEVLKIEVNTYEGHGNLLLTGNLKDVMKEACRAALTFIRSSCHEFNIDPKWFNQHDIHIHFPEGAVPKDGPSAGVATACAILSAITQIPAKADVAMTGETDLRGNSMPIGGLREKTLAAVREHIRLVLVPKENDKDVSELPEEITSQLEIKEVSTVMEVLPYVFTEDPTSAEARQRTGELTKVEESKEEKKA